MVTGLWKFTAAIIHVTLTPNGGCNWLEHTVATLYGLATA